MRRECTLRPGDVAMRSATLATLRSVGRALPPLPARTTTERLGDPAGRDAPAQLRSAAVADRGQ